MSPFLSLIQSVVVNIISHCVCKWLDGWFKEALNKETPFRSGNSVRGFSFALASTMSTLISYAFIICDSPQKSSVAQKVYKRIIGPGQ